MQMLLETFYEDQKINLSTGNHKRIRVHYDLRRVWFPRFGTPRGIIWIGTWRTLHPRQILNAPGAISVHGGVSLDEPRTRALRSGAECLSD